MFLLSSTRKTNKFHLIGNQLRRYASKKALLYQKCYEILKVSSDADQDTVRAAYIQIVKLVHPDSGHPDASAEKFSEVDNAFRILQAKYAKERRGIREDPEVEERDIKHTAPQHRQFLSYDGVGYGPPAQREKQYQQSRASKAHGKVVEYRIEKLSATEGELMKPGTFFQKHQIKTKYGFDRVVEDLILESMSKGDFDNLQGTGKPLSHAQSQNPYVDFVEHKINKILLDNGFTPEWITLQKEIRTEINDLNSILQDKRSYFGETPLDEMETAEWEKVVQSQLHRVEEINRKIEKYNLIVPILDQQMIPMSLSRVSDKVLKSKPDVAKRRIISDVKINNQKSAVDNEKGLLSVLLWWM